MSASKRPPPQWGRLATLAVAVAALLLLLVTVGLAVVELR